MGEIRTGDRLNVGCGTRIRPGWVNVDMATVDGVVSHDIRRGLPFPAHSFDLVYHSHVLEHLAPEQGRALLEDCYRVLRPGGVLRVVVPDLERIARDYLEVLEQGRREAGPEWVARHEWMVIELIDQSERDRSGGRMARVLLEPELPHRDFVMERGGAELRSLRERVESRMSAADAGAPRRSPLSHRIARRARRLLSPKQTMERLRRLLLGREDWEALQIGRFRRRGEIHRWMYDEFSLGTALTKAGFVEVRSTGAAESRVPGWADETLDTEPDGSVYKPHSLFMEGCRPEGEEDR